MSRFLSRAAVLFAATSAPCLGLASHAAAADTVAVWGGGAASWGVASKWANGVIPNNGSPAGATYAVQIDNWSGTSRVSVSSSYAVSSLRIDANDVVQLLSDSSKLTLARMTNAGTLTLGTSSFGSSLLLDAPTFTFGGGGTIAMAGGTISPANATATAALTITNQTLSGFGRVLRASLANQGTIRANAGTNTLGFVLPNSDVTNDGLIEADGGVLSIFAKTLTNRGSMVARNGGTLSLPLTTFTQSPTAQLVADGGLIVMAGPFENSRADAITIRNGGSVTFSAGVTNTGHVLLADAGSTLTFRDSAVNNGGGTLRAQLTGALNFSNAQVDNRAGRIELAGNATSLAATSGTLDNTGGTIDVRDDARFTMAGSVRGGTIATAGNATFELRAANLTDATVVGTVNITGPAGLGGTIRNQGTLNLAAGASVSANSPRTELTGGGTVNLVGSIAQLAGVTPIHMLVNRDNTLIGKGGGADGLENHALVRVEGPFRLGTVFNDADGVIRLLAGADVTTSGTITGAGLFDVQPGASLTVKAWLTVPALHNAGSMTLKNAGSNWSKIGSLTGGGDLAIRTYSNLIVGNLETGQLTLEWPASLTLQPTADAPPATPRAGRVRGIQFVGPGVEVIDLTDRGLVVDYDPAADSPLPALAAKVAAAAHYQYGAWKTGPITSANAAADPTNTAVGFAEASAVLGLTGNQTAMFLGQQVDASTVLIRTTVLGDANLDGGVNFGDLLALARSYNSTAATWSTGDFDYNGAVNFADLLILARHYNQPFDPAAAAALNPAFQADLAAAFASVPEPAALGAALLAPLLLTRRRRRRPFSPA